MKKSLLLIALLALLSNVMWGQLSNCQLAENLPSGTTGFEFKFKSSSSDGSGANCVQPSSALGTSNIWGDIFGSGSAGFKNGYGVLYDNDADKFKIATDGVNNASNILYARLPQGNCGVYDGVSNKLDMSTNRKIQISIKSDQNVNFTIYACVLNGGFDDVDGNGADPSTVTALTAGQKKVFTITNPTHKFNGNDQSAFMSQVIGFGIKISGNVPAVLTVDFIRFGTSTNAADDCSGNTCLYSTPVYIDKYTNDATAPSAPYWDNANSNYAVSHVASSGVTTLTTTAALPTNAALSVLPYTNSEMAAIGNYTGFGNQLPALDMSTTGNDTLYVIAKASTGAPKLRIDIKDANNYVSNAGTITNQVTLSTNYAVYKFYYPIAQDGGYGGSGCSSGPCTLNKETIKEFLFYINASTGNYAGTVSVDWFQIGGKPPVLPPTVQASNVTFTNVTSTSMTVNFTNGNGTNRLVNMRGNAVGYFSFIASNGTTYPANSVFGAGTDVSPSSLGEYIVYAGSGSSVNVTGLTPNTTYYVEIHDYNTANTPTVSNTAYLQANPLYGSQATLATAPTVAATNLTFTSVTSSAMTLNWTNGNGAKRYVVLKASSDVDTDPVVGTEFVGTAVFGTGAQTNTGNYIVYAGTGNSVTVTGLTASTTYYAKIYEYNGTSSSVNVLTSSILSGNQATNAASTLEPTVAASSLSFTAVTTNSMTLNWTNGNGASRIVVIKPGAAVDADPVDANGYTANTAFGSGSQLGTGNYVVYSGTGSSVSLTGLSASTTYYVKIYEFNGASSTANYLTSSTLSGNQATNAIGTAEPTTAASNLTFSGVTDNSITINWTNGNGADRIVLIKSGSAVNMDPGDGNGYSANASFGLGQQLGSGNYVVYGGTGSSVTVTGLSAATTYYVEVAEFNGSSSAANYLTSSTLTGNQATTATSTNILNADAFISSENLFPNPSSELVSITIQFKSSVDVKITMNDLMGREVMTIAEGNFSEINKNFDVSKLSKGIYTVNYSVNGAVKSEMLMVK